MKPSHADKELIRKEMRAHRACLELDWCRTAGDRIAVTLASLPEFAAAEVVLAYLDYPREVPMDATLQAAWRAGKRVAVPALREDGEYMPAWLTPADSTPPAKFGVRQPFPLYWAKPDRFDVVIVPGVAFTREGGRLGHGRGYYDRMLARLKPRIGIRVGVCFASHLVGTVPLDDHDVPMDLVVTETGVFRRTHADQADGKTETGN